MATHETLHNVTYLATAEDVARRVAENVAEPCSTFRFVAQSHEPVAKGKRLCQVSSNLSRNALRDKLHKNCSVTVDL